MQRIVAATSEPFVHFDEIGNVRHLGRDQDAIVAKPRLFGEFGRAERGCQHRLDVDVLGSARRTDPRILVHHEREKILIQRSPVHANAHRLVVLDGDLDDGAKVLVAPLATDISRIDAILRERPGAFRKLREQQVPVVVEVPDDRNGDTHRGETRNDLRDRCRRFLGVDRDANDLRAGRRERGHLDRGAGRVGGVGVRHRLHDHRMRRTHGNGADECSDGGSAGGEGHVGAGQRERQKSRDMLPLR